MSPEDFITALLSARMEPAAPSDPRAALHLLRFHRLEGLAVARDREAGGGCLTDAMREELDPEYRRCGLATTLVLEASERARAALRHSGVPSLLFKGAALVSSGAYPDPGSRRMDDGDLLVRPALAAAAVTTLLKAGFVPVTRWDPHKLEWLDAVSLLDPSAGDAAIDLHWRTEYGALRFGSGRESVLWDGADTVRGLPAPEVHMVLVAEHLLKHLRFKIHLTAFADLARVAEAVSDWDRVRRLTDRSPLARGIHALLEVVRDAMGGPVPVHHVRHRALERRLSPHRLLGRVRPVEGRLAGLRYRWSMLSGPGGVVRDITHAGLPSSPWLAARYGRGGVRGWLRYLTDVYRWTRYRGRSPASPNQELFDPTARE